MNVMQPMRRTQAARRDESDRSLIDAAIAVVARDGVSAATFDAIGRRAGYSRGLAAQRFGSKRGLIEAVIRHLHDLQEEALAAHGIDALPGLDAVLGFVSAYLSGLAGSHTGPAYFMLLSAAVADATELRAAFAAEHGRVEARLEALVRRGQADGTIRAELNPAAAALMVGSLLLGLSIQLLVDPSTDIGPIGKTILATLRLSFGSAN